VSVYPVLPNGSLRATGEARESERWAGSDR